MTARTNADVVVIGGGILGASIAWHLTQAGISDTVVVERNEVASGATAYTAGLVSLARTNRDVLSMVRCTLSAIAELEASFGQSVGFHRIGSMRVAEIGETSESLENMVSLLSSTGIEARTVDGRARARWSLGSTQPRRTPSSTSPRTATWTGTCSLRLTCVRRETRERRFGPRHQHWLWSGPASESSASRPLAGVSGANGWSTLPALGRDRSRPVAH